MSTTQRAGYTVTMFIVDVSPSMGEKKTIDLPPGPDGEPRKREVTRLEWVLEFVMYKVQEMIYHERKTEQCGVILFGTEETDNCLYNNGEYEHITEYIPVSQPNAETITKLQEIRPSTTVGDPIGALIVGIEVQDNLLRRKPTWTRKIVLLTDGENPMELQDWEVTAQKLNDFNVKMAIIGVDFDDDIMPYHEENKSRFKRENESFYRKFSEVLNESIVGTAAYALDECFRPDIKLARSVLMRSKLRIGDVEGRPDEAIELNIRTSKCTSISRPPSMKKFAKRQTESDSMDIDQSDSYVPLERKTEYVVRKQDDDADEHDDDKTEVDEEEIVEKENLVRGYKYGANFVPIGEEDEFERLEPNTGIDICGFFYRKNYRREWSMGEVYYVWADPDSYESQIAFSSIVRALFEKDAMAITRWTGRSDPKMGVLLPRVLESVDCFLWVQVPFADDVRKYTFRSLDNFTSKAGEKIIKHPHIPTEEQQKAMDSFVDAMDLMTAGDEDGEGNHLPWYDTVQSYNPAIHRIKQALFHGVITSDLATNPLPPPHLELCKYFQPPERVLKRSRDAVDECRKLFKIKPAPPKAVRLRKDAHMPGEDDDELIDLGALPARVPVKHPSSGSALRKKMVEKDDNVTDTDSEIEELEKAIEPIVQELSERKITQAEPSGTGIKSPSETEETARVSSASVEPQESDSPPLPNDRAPGRIIGNSHPLRDFMDNLKQGDVVTEAVRDLGATIKDVITKPFSSRRHQEMIQCMTEMRRVALEQDEIDSWNSFIRDLKNSCLNRIPHNKAFWKDIQKIGRPISLISAKEAKKAGGKSDVTEGTSVDFIEEDEEDE